MGTIDLVSTVNNVTFLGYTRKMYNVTSELIGLVSILSLRPTQRFRVSPFRFSNPKHWSDRPDFWESVENVLEMCKISDR